MSKYQYRRKENILGLSLSKQYILLSSTLQRLDVLIEAYNAEPEVDVSHERKHMWKEIFQEAVILTRTMSNSNDETSFNSVYLPNWLEPGKAKRLKLQGW
jgi:hypothetical protein